MNWLKRLFAKHDWRMVKQVDVGYIITNHVTGKQTDGHVLSYYLYENQFGKRIFDLVDSEEGDLVVERMDKSHFAFRNEVYRNKIKPWIDGRLDPEVPSYSQVPKDDFQNALAGKKVK